MTPPSARIERADLERRRLAAYRLVRTHEPSMDTYDAMMRVYLAAFPEAEDVGFTFEPSASSPSAPEFTAEQVQECADWCEGFFYRQSVMGQTLVTRSIAMLRAYARRLRADAEGRG